MATVEITRDEKDPRRAGPGRHDPFEVVGAVPGRKYRFVRDRPERVRDARGEGYEVLNASNAKGEKARGDIRMPQTEGAGDGTIRRGDTICMFMDADKHKEQKVKPNLDRIEHRTRGARQQFLAELRRRGLQPITE